MAATGLTTDQMLRNYRRLAALVDARTLAQPVARDAEDDAVLACARAARADLIITGDDDLLVLKRFEGISIYRAATEVHAADCEDARYGRASRDLVGGGRGVHALTSPLPTALALDRIELVQAG